MYIRLTVDNVENYMCVMRNVFSGHLKVRNLRRWFLTIVLHQVHKKYDLKGSTVEREASEKEKQKKEPTLKVWVLNEIQTPDLAFKTWGVYPSVTHFQDNDFVKDGVKITIGEEAKSKLMETLSADVQFLIK